ncbi:MAG: bifunctional oligoribonuclease/PAP phosphatase NrnA [Syntrophomonadaceae bacterium]|nr:bifunctional oligoribonuclease/PAP phosphatase NrnA [Syntrophomonadaceae bacterium]
MNTLKEISTLIRSKDNFLLIGHNIPDGDCIGSMLGLYNGLISMNKKVMMFLEDVIPGIYHYLPGVNSISSLLPPQENIENIIFLDCSDETRISEDIFEKLNKKATVFNIDHHDSNTFFGDYNYVDSKAAATAEVIYELLVEMNVPISKSIAESLYAGIVMDSGSFKYSNTSPKTHRIAADLLDKGVDLEKTRINLFESKPLEEVLLLGKALKNFNISPNGKIAWMLLPYEDIDEIGAHGLHPEGIINYTRMIKGVQIGIVFREVEPGLIKIGFRSKQDIDVALIAKEFGGGGHKQAAGAKQEGNINEVADRVLKIVEKMV